MCIYVVKIKTQSNLELNLSIIIGIPCLFLQYSFNKQIN